MQSKNKIKNKTKFDISYLQYISLKKSFHLRRKFVLHKFAFKYAIPIKWD